MTISFRFAPLSSAPELANVGRFTWQAGAALSANRVLTIDTQGDAIYYDPSSPDYQIVLGISATAAALGDDVVVLRSGQLVDQSWAWPGHQPLWCGAGGVVSAAPPESGWMVGVGFSLASDLIQIVIVDEVIRL